MTKVHGSPRAAPLDRSQPITAQVATDAEFRRGAWLQFRNARIRRIGRMPQPSDRFFAEFERVGGVAALFELRVRLLADNAPGLRDKRELNLTALVKAVVEHERADLLPEDEMLLLKCARLRNKLLHADFSKAAGTLLSLGVSLVRGTVYAVDLADGDVQRVADTSSAQGGVYGWVLEASGSGVFRQAFALLARGIALINWRLAVLSGVTETP
jgi:hypothetical protein